MKNVLVIGASGSLGSGIIAYLKEFVSVTGTYQKNRFDCEGVFAQKLDITKKESFASLVDHDVVVLVSGAMPASMIGYRPEKYIDVNIQGALNVLEYCRERKVKKLIYIMTFSDTSGSFYTGIPITHDGPRTLTLTGDHAVYSISKVAAVDLIEHYHQQYGLQTIVFRIPTVYCNDNNVNYYVDGELRTKAYIKMIRSVIKNRRIEIWGDPGNAKDMPYIKDFRRLVKLAVDSESAQGLYNAGTGMPVPLESFVDAVIEVFAEGAPVERLYRPDRPSQPNFTFDMSRTESEFGYRPEYDVVAMLRDIKATCEPSIWLQDDV